LEGGPVERVEELVGFQALDPTPLVTTGDSGAQLSSWLGVSGPVVPVLGQDPLATEDVDVRVTARRPDRGKLSKNDWQTRQNTGPREVVE
jgi:hypothetical protein